MASPTSRRFGAHTSALLGVLLVACPAATSDGPPIAHRTSSPAGSGASSLASGIVTIAESLTGTFFAPVFAPGGGSG